MAAAGSAAAATPNVAYAAGLTGVLGSLQPLGEASYPGTSPVSLAQISALGLVTIGAATDKAGPTSASSSVADVAVGGLLGLLPSLDITAVSSSCSFSASTGTVTGTASIVGGGLTSGLLPIALPTNPAPNTTINVLGLATITLNKQVSSGGTLEVDAISVSLLGGAETITLGTSVCNAADLTTGG